MDTISDLSGAYLVSLHPFIEDQPVRYTGRGAVLLYRLWRSAHDHRDADDLSDVSYLSGHGPASSGFCLRTIKSE